jgi:hypothetical protein
LARQRIELTGALLFGASGLSDLLAAKWENDALNVICPETSVLSNASEHSGAKLFIVMKCKYKIWPPLSRQRAMRTGLTFDSPANSHEGGEYTLGLARRP